MVERKSNSNFAKGVIHFLLQTQRSFAPIMIVTYSAPLATASAAWRGASDIASAHRVHVVNLGHGCLGLDQLEGLTSHWNRMFIQPGGFPQQVLDAATEGFR